MPGDFCIWPLLIPSLPKPLPGSESWAKARNPPHEGSKITKNITINTAVNFRVTEVMLKVIFWQPLKLLGQFHS